MILETPADGEAFIDDMRGGQSPIVASTARTYEVTIGLFLEHLLDSRYGWAQVCAPTPRRSIVAVQESHDGDCPVTPAGGAAEKRTLRGYGRGKARGPDWKRVWLRGRRRWRCSTPPIGVSWLLDGLWEKLRIAAAIKQATDGRRFTTNMERVLFALVANRAIEPMSKLSAAEWVGEDVAIPGLAAMDEDQAYRAMDLLVEADTEGAVQESVFFAVAHRHRLGRDEGRHPGAGVVLAG